MNDLMGTQLFHLLKSQSIMVMLAFFFCIYLVPELCKAICICYLTEFSTTLLIQCYCSHFKETEA